MPAAVSIEPSEYSENLQSKVVQLVDANIVEAAEQQCRYYRHGEAPQSLRVGEQVLLNNPTKGKLDPRWTGPWSVTGLKGPSSVSLKLGASERTVHINRVRPLLSEEDEAHEPVTAWFPPLFDHETAPSSEPECPTGDVPTPSPLNDSMGPRTESASPARPL